MLSQIGDILLFMFNTNMLNQDYLHQLVPAFSCQLNVVEYNLACEDKESVPKAEVGISGCSVSKRPVQAIAHRTQITEARASLLSGNFPLSLIPVDCRVNVLCRLQGIGSILGRKSTQALLSQCFHIPPLSSLCPFYLTPNLSAQKIKQTCLPNEET